MLFRSVDITIAHGSATLLACAVAGRPFVYRQISDTRFWAAGWRRRPRVAAYLRRARHVVALSAGAATALHEHLWLPVSRITVVPNAVPTAGFHAVGDTERAEARTALGLATDEFVALYIGALVPEKGVDLAIRAIASTTNARLMVAGGGSQELELQQLAQRLGAPVTFLGVLRDARAAYRATDLNVLPSRGGDSMPATLIEAGMCGLPSIATPIGSIEDVVLHDRTGFIVPVDDVDALTARIVELRNNPERRRQLGEAARAHCVAHFDIDVVAAQWIQVLERVTKR